MDIADFLARNGLVSRNGKPYRIDRVSYQILSNPFYYGHFRFLGEIHEGVHEPLITKKLFDQVQEIWKKRSRSWHEQRPVKPLTGLFRCGECGMMITAEQKTKHYRGTNRDAIYVYYRCTKKSKIIKCKQSFIRQEELDRQLSKMITTVSLRQD